MTESLDLPWRGRGDPPLDVARLPPFRGFRPLKRWRYLGVYGPSVQLCAGVVRIAGATQSFYAVHHRYAGKFRERAVPWSAIDFDDRAVRFNGASLTYRPAGEPVEVVSLHGKYPIWTRKTPVRVTGTVDDNDFESFGLLDESAGHHARVTRWSWSAGCGMTDDGREVTWNLVDGVHDAPYNSERTVWVDGEPREVGPQVFASELSAVGALRFTAEAERARHDRLVVVDSKYRQPFGTFSGTLPGVGEVDGFGVMEEHDVRW